MMSPAIGFALLAAYFMVAAESSSIHSVGVFRMSFAGFGPTELRIVLAAGASQSRETRQRSNWRAVTSSCSTPAAPWPLPVSSSRSSHLSSEMARRSIGPSRCRRSSGAPRASGHCVSTGGLGETAWTPRGESSWSAGSSSSGAFRVRGAADHLCRALAPRVSWLAATAVAVEGAIVNNFAWHRSWTWRERADSGQDRWLVSFAKFNAGTAPVTSIGGNVAVMALVLGVLHIGPIVANIVAVGVMSAADFLLADRWVFAARFASLCSPALEAYGPPPSPRSACCLAPTVLAEPKPATISAWGQIRRRDRGANRPGAPPARDPPCRHCGRRVRRSTSATARSRTGAARCFIPRISLEQLLEHLQEPGTPRPREDVSWHRGCSAGPT